MNWEILSLLSLECQPTRSLGGGGRSGSSKYLEFCRVYNTAARGTHSVARPSKSANMLCLSDISPRLGITCGDGLDTFDALHRVV